MKNEHDFELEGGWTVTADYEYDSGEPEIRYYEDGSGHPGSPPSATVYSLWASLPDANGLMVRVNVLNFLEDTGVVDRDSIEADILEDKLNEL